MTLKMRKRKPNKYQKLITKFCKEPEKIWKNRGIIKREMGVAKKLFEFIPEESLWAKLHLPFKLNSLAWFLSEDGKEYLIKYKKTIELSEFTPEVYVLAEEKIGKDKQFKTRPKNLLDFLK